MVQQSDSQENTPNPRATFLSSFHHHSELLLAHVTWISRDHTRLLGRHHCNFSLTSIADILLMMISFTWHSLLGQGLWVATNSPFNFNRKHPSIMSMWDRVTKPSYCLESPWYLCDCSFLCLHDWTMARHLVKHYYVCVWDGIS